MRITKIIRRRLHGTRLEPVFDSVVVSLLPQVSRVGSRDHRAMQIALPMLVRHDYNGVDVGANQGEFVEWLSKACPAGKHVAFEPLPHHAATLRERFPNIKVHELALSDAPGDATFNVVLDDDAFSGLKRTDYDFSNARVKQIPVKLARLDDVLCPEMKVDVLKIDVEGAELGVLAGAEKTIERCRPIVIFEFQKERARHYDGATPEAMFDLLVMKHHYSLFLIDGTGPLSREETIRVFDRGTCFNFVARDY